MPIYEFLCPSCNRIYSFLAMRADTDRVPRCPRCGSSDMRRVPSRFGIGGRAGQRGGQVAVEDERQVREVMRLLSEMEGVDEENPRQMAKFVRRMAEVVGEPVGGVMEEMISRLEAGEDPERVEEELGEALEEEVGTGASEPERDEGLYPL